MSRSAAATPRVMDWDSIQFPSRAMTPRTFTPLYLSQDFQRDPDIVKLLPRVRNKIKRVKLNYPGIPTSPFTLLKQSSHSSEEMTQRVPRFPPLDARMVRLEEGPPMYRMLGYADKNSFNYDICDPMTPSYFGAFSIPRLLPNQVFTFGPGRYGLPQACLPFTTSYWSDSAYRHHQYITRRPQNRLVTSRSLPEERPLAKAMPEMAVPGSGVNSRCSNSGYHYIPGLPPPGAGWGQK